MKMIQLSPWAVAIWRMIYIPGIIFEVTQAVDGDAGDTLSELLVARFTQSWAFHGAFTGFFIWAVIHWRLFDNPAKGMALVGPWWVLSFTLAGIGLRYAVKWKLGW